MRLLLLTLVISCASSFKLPFKMGGFRNTSVDSTSPKPSFLGMFSLTPQITVSKFPPIFELIVQRIQAQFSNYVHEDLSRPATYDKPVYTLAPDEVHLFNDDIPLPLKPPIMVIIESFELINSADYNSTIEIEYEIKNANKILQGADGDSYSYNTTIFEGVRGLLKQKNRSEEIIGIVGFNETTNYNIFGEDVASFANRFNETMKKNVSAILENERMPRKTQILIAITKFDNKIFANIIEVLRGENREKFLNLINNHNLDEKNILQKNKHKVNSGRGPNMQSAENIETVSYAISDEENIKNVIPINSVPDAQEYDQESIQRNKGYGKNDYEQEFAEGVKENTSADYEQRFNQQQRVVGNMEDSEVVLLTKPESQGSELFDYIQDVSKENVNILIIKKNPEDQKYDDGVNYALEYEENQPADDENFVITNYERNSFKPLRRIFNYREERDVKVSKKKHSFRPKPESIIVGPIVVKEEDLGSTNTAPKDVGSVSHVHLPMIAGYLDGEDESFLRKQEVDYEFSTKRTTSWPLDEIGRK